MTNIFWGFFVNVQLKKRKKNKTDKKIKRRQPQQQQHHQQHHHWTNNLIARLNCTYTVYTYIRVYSKRWCECSSSSSLKQNVYTYSLTRTRSLWEIYANIDVIHGFSIISVLAASPYSKFMTTLIECAISVYNAVITLTRSPARMIVSLRGTKFMRITILLGVFVRSVR